MIALVMVIAAAALAQVGVVLCLAIGLPKRLKRLVAEERARSEDEARALLERVAISTADIARLGGELHALGTWYAAYVNAEYLRTLAAVRAGSPEPAAVETIRRPDRAAPASRERISPRAAPSGAPADFGESGDSPNHHLSGGNADPLLPQPAPRGTTPTLVSMPPKEPISTRRPSDRGDAS